MREAAAKASVPENAQLNAPPPEIHGRRSRKTLADQWLCENQLGGGGGGGNIRETKIFSAGIRLDNALYSPIHFGFFSFSKKLLPPPPFQVEAHEIQGLRQVVAIGVGWDARSAQ